MSKRKPAGKRAHRLAKKSVTGPEGPPEKGGKGPAAEEPAGSRMPSSAALRETIESVVVAFVLAFLFRTFEAEAFVIPTGSMAPTLMGRHKDLHCKFCDYPFRVSASEEVNPDTGAPTGDFVEECICPMCRSRIDLGYREETHRNHPPFKGDRILVGKFCYQFSDPKRWDVAVFKYPEGAKTNFIKRLVGLPNELLWIRRGDVFTGELPTDDEMRQLSALPRLRQLEVLRNWTKIERKPPEKLLAMLQPVFDNDYAPAIIKQGWPARWRPWDVSPSQAGAWQALDDKCSFHTDGTGEREVWLRYEHRVPSADDWRQWKTQQRHLQRGQRFTAISPRPQLISDFSAYNTGLVSNLSQQTSEAERLGLHWVGDLAIQCTLEVGEVRSESDQAIFELVEGGRRFQCRINVADGAAVLAVDGEPSSEPAIETGVRGPGQYEIIFSNCDDQLRLWVDGSVVASKEYRIVDERVPTEADLAPVGVGSQGAALKISHLKVHRDVYYIAVKNAPLTDYGRYMDAMSQIPDLSDPPQWAGAFSARNMKHVFFAIKEDQFLALGDNSAKSKDSRLWAQDHFVGRDLLIGKALYIYWPDTRYKLRLPRFALPVFPNFAGMGFVR